MKLQTSIQPNALGVVHVVGEDRQNHEFKPDADGVLVCDISDEPTIARLLSLGDTWSEALDNFYLSGGNMLRSQTSTVQIRVMESQPPPVRVIAIGRVYRPDTVDATHSFMFHQIEGLMVDKGVTMADLKTVLRLFARSYLGEDVKIRFRPSFFPFTEPSVEVDMLWHGGDRWVEMGGAGMVDPNVFRAVGYDPDEVTGFAFGLGIERLCMRRHGIDDIRLLYQNDARFLGQF